VKFVVSTTVNIADQSSIDTTLPKAKAAGIGVIAKRPIANAAWKTGRKPVSAYHHVYWDRLQELDNDFLRDGLEDSISIALRFTLAQPGMATAIVGTAKPDRWAATRSCSMRDRSIRVDRTNSHTLGTRCRSGLGGANVILK
jgi:aryl-alcohol dehydrogenase-like predicted oxidoreductase